MEDQNNLYPHQKEFLNSDNNNSILCWECGTGKSHAAKLWLKQKGRSKNPVVICPKQIKQEWQDDVPEARVYSFEDFKKAATNRNLPSNPTAIIVDEADAMASPLFVAKLRSQRTEHLYNYVMESPKAHILLATATPIRSSPYNGHTLLVLARIVSPDTWKKFRDKYFSLQYKPYLPRPAYLPVPGWRKMMQDLINKYTHVALMSDMVDLPPETHEVIKLKEPDYTENEEWEPAKQFAFDHRLEQEEKHKAIKKASKGYRKVVVVAKYTAQIDDLEKKLSKERETFVLDGRTKDAHQTIKDAEDSDECYFIIQAQVGAGFELPSFAIMIFASHSYGARDYVQMIARVKRINALKPLLYIDIHAGRCDKMVYKTIQEGKTFVPSQYLRV